ncbi:hypothetical protein [Psychrobacter lutiphocae]|uniref:hypothetical protein n=1 Tax=Psychrobacter lutiphocae TaxID=540500 RepID=UPI0003672DEE|nr:hypothetical protein [Psychrobacter lutiphocae]
MNAHPDNIRLAVDLAKLAKNKPQYQHDAEMAIMNRDFKAFSQSWKDALTSPSYYLFLATNASGTIVAKSAASKVYVYRKMSITEANLTLRTNKLQPPKIGSNSSKYLSEDLEKVRAFSNRGVTEPEVIVRFELEPSGYNSLMSKAVDQKGSKGVKAIKLNTEGITAPGLTNIGVPSDILENFNKIIKKNGVKIYEK